MFQVQNLSKSYGVATVLAGVSFIINDHEHVGLLGPNGSGKTTLLRCVTGQEQPDSGSVIVSPQNLTVGYLAQEFAVQNGTTVRQVIDDAGAAIVEVERALQAAADALATSADPEAAMAAYTDALASYEALGGYEREHQAEAVLQGLGLGEVDLDTPVSSLSGGQKTRLGIAVLLIKEPDLLLLDEPTNHLDVEALEWLEGFVNSYRGSVLVVSHDRLFLDRTVTRILYLDPDTHAVKSYTGNYSDFAVARAEEREKQYEAWQRQQEYIAKTEADIARIKRHAQSIENSTRGAHRATPKSPEERQGLDHVRMVARKKARLAKTREHKLERYLESEERVEKPRASWWLRLDFGVAPQGGKSVLRMEDVSFAYPGSPPLFEGASLDVEYGERVALVGPNGAGKTTLLRLIDGTLDPSSGVVRVGPSVRMGRLAQEQETLDPGRTVLQTVLLERPMSETQARNFLHYFLFEGDEPLRKVGECSLGQRTRLQLALLVMQGCNLLLLDEPLNHLDIDGREHFQAALEAFEGTVIVVAHDRAFLHSYPDRILEVRNGRVSSYAGTYADYLRWTPAPVS